jgi:alanine racemase
MVRGVLKRVQEDVSPAESGAVHGEGRPTWAEISLAAIQDNFSRIQRHVGTQRKVLAVVKADAYGHGAPPVARALERAGADWFGVTCTSEGAELREAGIRKPILILSGTWPGEERAVLEYGLTPAVHRIEDLLQLERGVARESAGGARKSLRFHLKIDTGMNRLGISPEDVAKFAAALAGCPHLQLESTFTHFASSEDFSSGRAAGQEKVFAVALQGLRAAGIDPGIVHMANSAAVASRESSWADMVRPGALLYGYHQNYDTTERRLAAERKLPLTPALSLRARIISLRDVPAGEGVGYNSKFVTSRPSRIAVLPLGYADGMVRQLSGRGRVLVRGVEAPLVGTISMDLSMVDVTDLPQAQVGDTATLFGADGDARISPFQVARELGTVTSDLLCALGKRVPRYYLA